MNGIDLAEIGSHLPDLQEQSGRQRRKRDITFLDVYPFLSKGNEYIRARVGIDNRLYPQLRFMQLQ